MGGEGGGIKSAQDVRRMLIRSLQIFIEELMSPSCCKLLIMLLLLDIPKTVGKRGVGTLQLPYERQTPGFLREQSYLSKAAVGWM
jgi:hypothetical protein